MRAGLLALSLVAALAGCGESDLEPIPGTAVRVAEPVTGGDAGVDLRLHIFADPDDCAAKVGAENLGLCVPFVDRATGQVRVAFQMRVDGEPWPVPLTEENIQVFHKNQEVRKDTGRNDYTIIPHDPTPADQLFVLMLDDTYSMGLDDEGRGVTRLDKVKQALLDPEVVDAFLPEGSRNAVLPLLFRGGKLPEPLMGRQLVTKRKEYRQIIKDGYVSPTGYTPLYEGIEYSATTALALPEVAAAIQQQKLQPTVIILTDGFHNPKPSDTCGSNAPALERLLKKLDSVRRGDTEKSDIRYRPLVYTVGLGRKAWRESEKNKPEGTSVSVSALCRGKGDQLIDGNLERRGVDNIALDWIARVGGGASFIKRDADGLSEAFKAAAATRYAWYEARYRVDPFFLRRSFNTRLVLRSLNGTDSSITFHPSAWMDAPPGVASDENGWTQPGPYSRTTTVLFPLLGALAALGYLPSAWFNVRRALFSRVARKR